MNIIAQDILMHYGIKRRSGRYPWGSGEDPYQHDSSFLNRIRELKDSGLSEKEIADYFGMGVKELREEKSLATNRERAERVSTVEKLKAEGLNTYEIGRRTGLSESTVRSLLDQSSKERMNSSAKTADFLKSKVDELGIIDVGSGVEQSPQLGVSSTMMSNALRKLQDEGYIVTTRKVSQQTNPGKYTIMKVLCPPGTTYKEIMNNDNIHSIDDYTSLDGGLSFKPKFVYPSSMDSKRLDIVYGDKGGKDRDGLVEIRPGVEDLSLGNSHYAQVRILVDGTHYIKGMAVYSDDLPDGIDVRFHTNKDSSKSKMEVLKEIDTKDPKNPFGSLIKEDGGQSYYTGKDGKEHLSLINKRAEEGDWGEWADKLPSQFLAKQSTTLIEKQLNLSKAMKQQEFDDINALTNGTVKKRLMESFADDCDAAAVHLKAAALPRQKYQVIIPIASLKDNEVYAPNYRPGEEVALIRFPHGGTFEIPILKVNNKNQEGQKVIGKNPFDAIGINAKVAERLSGADFDGDTVMVIPTKGVNGRHGIVSTPALKGLKDFDPKEAYPERKGMKYMKDPNSKKDATQSEMGKISNLITDMTLKGAPQDDIARAVRHSMVVIDAGKHKLDYKQSETDNCISALKKTWQGRVDPEDGKYHEGASTLISASKSEKRVDKRVGSPHTNIKGSKWYDPTRPEGVNLYKQVEEYYTDKNGKTVKRESVSTKMQETDNAFTLSSGTIQEKYYAEYANYMKGLANTSRKTAYATKDLQYNPESRKKYKTEVDSIMAKLSLSEKNKPKERKAQLLSGSKVKAIKEAYPDITKKELKKIRQTTLQEAREKVGAERHPIIFTDKEWEAVQSGAITQTSLRKIMQYADLDKLREQATPKDRPKITSAKESTIKSLYRSGYTMQEIADRMGVSRTTITNVLKA